MKRDISLWQLWGFGLTVFVGTLLHFLYDWTNESILTAWFSAVNESTWEHMKILYVPMLIFALVQRRFFKDYENFWCVKALGFLTGLVLIPIIFYTYNGAIGKSPDWLNIAIFILSAAAVFFVEARLLRKNSFRCKNKNLAIAVICLIGLLFVLLTFMPPQLGIFRDPLTNTYGI